MDTTYHTECGCTFEKTSDMERIITTLPGYKKIYHYECKVHKERFSHRVVVCIGCGKVFEYRRKDNNPGGLSPKRCSQCIKEHAREIRPKNPKNTKSNKTGDYSLLCQKYEEFCSGRGGHCIMPMFPCKIGNKQPKIRRLKDAAF